MNRASHEQDMIKAWISIEQDMNKMNKLWTSSEQATTKS